MLADEGLDFDPSLPLDQQLKVRVLHILTFHNNDKSSFMNND